MDFMKKGPEIKLSELKVPQVLSDLYWDLKDRYLLPAVALLLVAIVAVPLVLSSSSEPSWQEQVEDGTVAEEIAGASAVPPATGELVDKEMPGLRDYRRRLRDLEEKDPFVQQFSDGGEGNTATATTSTEATPGSSATAPGESGPSGGSLPAAPESPPTEPSSNPSNLTWFSYALDVRVVSLGEAGSAPENGGAKESNTTIRHNLPELTVLPSREAPAAIYMGVTKDEKKALLMISDQVQGIFGDATCILGSKSCQLLAVEPGLPVTFVYGPAERTFRIEVLKLRLLNTDHLNRAPLGSDKDKKKGGDKNSAQGLAQITPTP